MIFEINSSVSNRFERQALTRKKYQKIYMYLCNINKYHDHPKSLSNTDYKHKDSLLYVYTRVYEWIFLQL